MTITDRLEAVRKQHNSCSAIAFTDLSTLMVLASSTEVGTKQERLDALCSEAAVVLIDNPIQSARKLFETASCKNAFFVVLPDGHGVRIYVTLRSSDEEVLCAQCTEKVNVKAFIQSLQNLIWEIGEMA